MLTELIIKIAINLLLKLCFYVRRKITILFYSKGFVKIVTFNKSKHPKSDFYNFSRAICSENCTYGSETSMLLLSHFQVIDEKPHIIIKCKAFFRVNFYKIIIPFLKNV